MLSVGAAWGVMALVWQEGHGSDEIWGIAATGSIASWIPLMVFAFLYGLSMDYEVFILARMREEYDKTGRHRRGGRLRPRPHRPAGHERGADPVPRLRGAGLRARDRREDPGHRPRGRASCSTRRSIRALLVPAVVSLFGRWNWWLPPGRRALLRVRPLAPEPLAEGARPEPYAALVAGPSFASRSTPSPSSCDAVAALPLRSSYLVSAAATLSVACRARRRPARTSGSVRAGGRAARRRRRVPRRRRGRGPRRAGWR